MDIKNNVIKQEIESVYGKISPFEFKSKLINLAKEQSKKSAHSLLDAGRGNPNWTAATPREAFFAFGQFAVLETRRVWSEDDLAGMPEKEGIAERLYLYIDNHNGEPGIELLRKILDYGILVQNPSAASLRVQLFPSKEEALHRLLHVPTYPLLSLVESPLPRKASNPLSGVLICLPSHQ
jgi:aspartate 4-decarboxylase